MQTILTQKFPEYPIEISFDMDDVMENLCEQIATSLGLDYQKWDEFHIHSNTHFSVEQKDAIYEAFKSVETYKALRFYPGADKILRVRKLGAKVKIKSSSMSPEVLDYKEWILKRTIPSITDDDLELNLVGENKKAHKRYPDTTFIAIDDGPYNIAESEAMINVMPSWQPWSVAPRALQLVSGRHVLWLPSLEAINDFVYQQVKIWSTLY